MALGFVRASAAPRFWAGPEEANSVVAPGGAGTEPGFGTPALVFFRRCLRWRDRLNVQDDRVERRGF